MISANLKVIEPHVVLRVKDFVGNIGGGGEYETYDGEYEVTPKGIPQMLETKHKNMKENVTIKEIPTHKVSNNFGTTFIIGEN